MKKNFNDLIKTSEIPVLVDFYADWCGPCQVLSPIVQELASDFQGKIKVIKVNIDKNQPAAIRYQIKAVPTLVLFFKGKTLWRQSGAPSKHQLRQILEQQIRNFKY